MSPDCEVNFNVRNVNVRKVNVRTLNDRMVNQCLSWHDVAQSARNYKNNSTTGCLLELVSELTMSLPSIPICPPFYFKGVRFMPLADLRAVEQVESFEVRDDDVFVSAYQKSGTTWTQQIVSLIFAEGDVSEVSKIPLMVRVPWLESMDVMGTGKPFPEVLKSAPSPRLMKTHLPYHLLPPQAREGKGKIIYCARNVKDVIVSFHNMRAGGKDFPSGTFDENFEEFISPEQAYFGFWWDVVQEYWRHKDAGNMLFIKFEDMKQDLRGHVVKIANFLGKTLSDQRIDEVVANCTFSAMKENPATNFTKNPAFKGKTRNNFEFMRKGEVGDWKNWLTDQQSRTLDAIYQEKMKDVDLTFEFQ